MISIFSAHLQKVIAFSSSLPSCSILFKLQDVTPPSRNQWIKDMMQNIKLEKIKCALNGSTKRVYKTWDPLINYVKSLPDLENI